MAVDSCDEYVVGLKADGTVVVAGADGGVFGFEFNNASDLTDIVAITAHRGGVIGLKADGTAIDDAHTYDLSLWKDIKLPESLMTQSKIR